MTAVALEPKRELMSPEAVHVWRQRRRELFTAIFEPPEILPLSQWTERHFRLSPESSGEPGPIFLDKTPYLRAVLDTLTDPLIERTVFQKPSRVGGTVVGNAWLAHTIAEDPGPMMLVLPTLDMAKAWSKEQLAPMLRDVPVLAGRVAEVRARDSNNTILQKMFLGGSITVGGSNSPSLFRMRTVRNIWASDIDDPNFVKNPEGDTITLAWNRAETMPGAKGYFESSPGHALTSRICPLYEQGDRREFYVPCPHCNHYQVLIWKHLRYKEVQEPVYLCEQCQRFIPEQMKYRMNLAGEWRPGAEFKGVASFRMNSLYSPFPGATWPKLVAAWEDANIDNTKRQVFINTKLAEPWEERGGKVRAEGLHERRQDYGCEVPRPVRVLTLTVDVQHNRLECKVKGWAPGLSSCLIAYVVLPGSPVQKDLWAALDQLRARVFTRADGTEMRIAGTGIDTGDGTFIDEVYAYVTRHRGQRVFALKGSSNPSAPPLPRKPTRNNKGRVPLYVIGTNALKSTVFGRLKIAVPGPGYMFFPQWAEDEYFKQLTSESPRQKYVNGRWLITWYCRPGDRNEAWDLEVYSLAVLKILQQESFLNGLPWEDWVFGKAARLPSPPSRDPDPDRPEEDPAELRRAQRRRRGGYLRDL